MYKQDIFSMDVVIKVLLRDENSHIQWNTLFDLPWPPVTSNDYADQIFLSYVVSGRNLNIHAKNCVPRYYC